MEKALIGKSPCTIAGSRSGITGGWCFVIFTVMERRENMEIRFWRLKGAFGTYSTA